MAFIKKYDVSEIDIQEHPKNNTFKDLDKKTFGRLSVIGFAGRIEQGPKKDKRTMWWCRCACGAITRVHSYNLTGGTAKSCGCLRNEKSRARQTIHGLYKSVEMTIFSGAKFRCTDKRGPNYKYYGARGIKFLYKDFKSFYKDLGPRPSNRHSIDRIDVDGHYEPGNCRWATTGEQANNKTNTIRVTIEGTEYNLKEHFFGRETGKYDTFRSRVRRYGWPVKTAIFWDNRKRPNKKNPAEIIEPMSLADCIKMFGIPKNR